MLSKEEVEKLLDEALENLRLEDRYSDATMTTTPVQYHYYHGFIDALKKVLEL